MPRPRVQKKLNQSDSFGPISVLVNGIEVKVTHIDPSKSIAWLLEQAEQSYNTKQNTLLVTQIRCFSALRPCYMTTCCK